MKFPESRAKGSDRGEDARISQYSSVGFSVEEAQEVQLVGPQSASVFRRLDWSITHGVKMYV